MSVSTTLTYVSTKPIWRTTDPENAPIMLTFGGSLLFLQA